MASNENSYINKPNGVEEEDREYAERMLENIERGSFDLSRSGELLNTASPIDLERWTTSFIVFFNGVPTTINKNDNIIVNGSRNSPSSASVGSDPKQTQLIEYSDTGAGTNETKSNPFTDASILDSIGDGTCLVHSYFNALSPTYRSLAKKYQRLIGLFFRKYVYANSKLLNEPQKNIAKRLQSDSGEETYLDDSDAENLSKLLGKNTLIFIQANSSSGNNCRYIKVNDGPAIFLYYSTARTHYDTIRFTNVSYTQTNEWIEKNLPTAYVLGNAVYLNGIADRDSAFSFDLADVFLREASRFLGQDAAPSISPSDLFLDAVSNFLAPPKNKKSATFKDEDNMSDVSDDGEETIEEYIPAIYDTLNHYLGHIYKVMKSIKKSGDKKQFRDMGTDPASKFVPTTIENNTECNGPFTVEVQTIKTDVQGNQIENSTECL